MVRARDGGVGVGQVLAAGLAGAASFAAVGDVNWVAAVALTAGGVGTSHFGARLAARLDAQLLKVLTGNRTSHPSVLDLLLRLWLPTVEFNENSCLKGSV